MFGVPVISEQAFKATYRREPGHASVVEAESEARERGLVGVSLKDKRFDYLNKLAAFTLFSGAIDRQHNVELTDKEANLLYARNWLAGLGADSFYRRGHKAVITSSGGALVGRSLRALGIPHAVAKAKLEELELPFYVRSLVSRLKRGRFRGEERARAQRILKDFVKVLFLTRKRDLVSGSGASYEQVELPSLATEEAARSFGGKVQELLRVVEGRKSTLSVIRKPKAFCPRLHLAKQV